MSNQSIPFRLAPALFFARITIPFEKSLTEEFRQAETELSVYLRTWFEKHRTLLELELTGITIDTEEK